MPMASRNAFCKENGTDHRLRGPIVLPTVGGWLVPWEQLGHRKMRFVWLWLMASLHHRATICLAQPRMFRSMRPKAHHMQMATYLDWVRPSHAYRQGRGIFTRDKASLAYITYFGLGRDPRALGDPVMVVEALTFVLRMPTAHNA
jgi:hypothetical protein